MYKFQKLNATTKKDPYHSPFTHEVLNTIIKHESYSFLYGYFGYHHIFITPKDRYKITFVTNQEAFIWKMMSFGVKIGLPIY